MSEVESLEEGRRYADVLRSLRHRFEYAVYRITRAVLITLPEELSLRLGSSIGWFAGVVVRIRREDVDKNLARAFPGRTRAWRQEVARRSYMHFGREAAFLFRMSGWSMEDVSARVQMLGFAPLLEASERNRGVLLLTAHLGNWEMAGASIVASGIPIDVVGKRMSNRRFGVDVFETRKRAGMRMIDVAEASKDVLRSLGSGRIVALLGDQNASSGGLFVRFFGVEASTSRGPAIFALRRDVPVFVGFAIRRPGHGQRYVIEALQLDFKRTGDLEVDTRSMLTAYHRILERAIISAPDQYFWQHKRWKTRPPEEGVA
ncbi:hypothetical protein OAJ07_02800 [Gemmatimonadales bacterium]|nr:hypothetical protein [Gemmatimonadales bacterium]